MRIYACPSCSEVCYFENSICIHCGTALAFSLRDKGLVAVDDNHRQCANFEIAGCNWLAELQGQPLCSSCVLTRTFPSQADTVATTGWRKIEAAKRRLIYELRHLGLLVWPKSESARGLAFDLLMPLGPEPVVTGHEDGVITLNVREAESPFREEVRIRLGEPYRTLLGHLRHEVGHYFWERLVASNESRLSEFRNLFGDDRASYSDALSRHYAEGAPSDWPSRCVSAYASMHPWEDWAETWAHYLHMVDAVDTGRSYGVQLRARKDPSTGADTNKLAIPTTDNSDEFSKMMAYWYPLTFALNGLNRSMGHSDWYPFALSNVAVTKLRFVAELVMDVSSRTGA